MISSLNGKLVSAGTNQILLDVNGVGFSIFVSRKVLNNLASVNEQVHILTYLDVKENSLALYGFYDAREREIFKMLITVSGISSKTAHTILSYIGFEDIIGLITNPLREIRTKIPGVGTKKLELISTALKDKIFKLSYEGEISSVPEEGKGDIFEKEKSRLDALNALMNLGYVRNEAEKIIREVLKQNPDVTLTTEEIIKKALELIH